MSQMIPVPVANATEAQLRSFAEVQQYDISEIRAGDVPGLLALIRGAWSADTIFVTEDAPAAQSAQAAPVSLVAQNRLTGGNGANDPKVLLKVGTTPYPGGGDPVPLGHNGVTVVLQRNILTEIPYRYYLVLQDAIRGEYSQDLSSAGAPGTNQSEPVETEYTNYPLSHVTLPSQEEVEAWHARVDEVSMPA